MALNNDEQENIDRDRADHPIDNEHKEPVWNDKWKIKVYVIVTLRYVVLLHRIGRYAEHGKITGNSDVIFFIGEFVSRMPPNLV